MTAAGSPGLRPLALDVVSVQSQVVYGRVGNAVAVPTLDALGLAVAAVPTVVFSNTPHYPTMHGGALPADWVEGYLQDLTARGALAGLRAVLLGYLGNPQQAAVVARWVRARLAERAALGVVIDPVIGDHDHGVYVDAGLVEAYRRDLLPLADGVTPNGFELAQLTGRSVHDVDSVIAAARALLTGHTQWVAVTSAAPDTWAENETQVVLVTRTRAEVIAHPRIGITPKGTGDLFCAALTGHWLRGRGLRDATTRACRHVVEALRRTEQAQCAELLLPLPGHLRGDATLSPRRHTTAVAQQARQPTDTRAPARASSFSTP
ncbi:pyridoxine/pyridoxal/pyridoxamine kinase [Luteimonas sp. TWI1416]|uniref:pyridoxine/pyridoxal/pyridoxamine kinase n=1 Tax=unclassified Luteimonas TaxID=2629088 RepID=UPI003208F551